MKTVLVISYYFPPRPGIGSQRPYALAKYLPQFGWNPVVLTAKLPEAPSDGLTVIESPYENVLAKYKSSIGMNPAEEANKQWRFGSSNNYLFQCLRSYAIKLGKEIIGFPDPYVGWYKSAIEAGDKFLLSNKVDAIISSAHPLTCHLIARELHKRHSIPWIADFRDLWTQNHYYDKTLPILTFERLYESLVMKHCSAMVTVSEPLAELLRTKHHKKVHTITNSFDSEDFNYDINIPSDILRITYTGQLYAGKRDPELLFKALNCLFEHGRIQRSRVRVDFFGPVDMPSRDLVTLYALGDVVAFHETMSRDQAVIEQMSSHILLLLLWDNPREIGVYTGKLFEYLGAKRPILALGGPKGVVSDLLESTNAGLHANKLETVTSFLLSCFKELNECGRIEYGGNQAVDEYSAIRMSGKFASILEDQVQTLNIFNK